MKARFGCTCLLTLGILALLTSGQAQSSGESPPLELRPFETLEILEPGHSPHQISFSRDGKIAYIAATGSNHITFVDIDSLQVLQQYRIDDGPIGIVPLSGQRLAASRYRSDRVSVYKMRGNAAAHLVVGKSPSMVYGPLPNGRYLVSVESLNRLCVLDLEERDPQVTQFYSTGQHPLPPSATSDGRLALVPNSISRSVTRIDLTRALVLDEVALGGSPGIGAVLPGDKFYAVPLRDKNQVVLVNTESGEITAEWQDGIGESPFALAVSPDGQWMFVGNTASADVSVIELGSGRVVARLAVGPVPLALSIDPTGRTLWVSSEGSHTVAVLEIPARWDPLPEDLPVFLDSHTAMLAAKTSEERICSQIEREVIGLQEFYVEWFKGESTPAGFQRLTGVLADDFEHISPAGVSANRFNLLRIVQSAFGQNDRLQIETHGFTCRAVDANSFLATYEQWQKTEEKIVGRKSSAVFRLRNGTPNGVEWVHLHETPVPEGENR